MMKRCPDTSIMCVCVTAGEIISTVSHIMVPNPTKTIVAETQARLTDIISELERNLTRLMLVLKGDQYLDMRRLVIQYSMQDLYTIMIC